MPNVEEQSWSFSWHSHGVGRGFQDACLGLVLGDRGRGQARREPSSTAYSARPSVPGSFTIHCGHFH